MVQNFKDPLYYDTKLSPRGLQQARALNKQVDAVMASAHAPECVLVSPLSRTLHTLELGFAGHLGDRAGPGGWNDVSFFCRRLFVDCNLLLTSRPNKNKADMLLGSTKGGAAVLTPSQSRAQFSMWAIMAAPLLATSILSTGSPKIEIYEKQ